MHTLKTITTLTGFMLLFAISGHSQTTGLVHFSDLSVNQRIDCSQTALEKIFLSVNNTLVEIVPAKKWDGTIISRINPNSATVSLNIRLSDAEGSFLHLSKTSMANGQIQYTGIILPLHGKMGFRLQEENGSYYFMPLEQRLIIAD